MNRHALRVVEFHRVLERVAARAASELGRARVLELVPSRDRGFLAEELARVNETLRFRMDRAGWAPPIVPDARSALRRLALEGGVLQPDELFTIGTLLSAGRHLSRGLREEREVAEAVPRLVHLADRLVEDEEVEKEIGRTVEKDGHMLDSASKELGRIRASLRKAQGRIVRTLDDFLASLPDRIRVSDASVSLRGGRYVVPVRREGQSEVGGIVHGESATGATLFIEPPVAIDLMNVIKRLESDEAREIQRILRSFSRRLHPEAEALEGSQDALVDFDSLWARAKTAEDWDASVPELLPPGAREMTIVGGRHPLLLEGAGAEDPPEAGEVVPFDLLIEPDERAVVVSGPNTGGKTVFLKAIGLCVALTQSGIVPPVRPGTRLPIFGDIFADIGDEQSIAESLSTFSAHLANLKAIVDGADERSLVLVDEMGTGTDPAEGAALARAILESLVERGSLSVVTSHLGALKHLDTEGSGFVNASLQFDPDRMEPTYRLVKGRPGRSYGLAIARRLGLSGEILDRAEEHLSAGEVRVEDLLEKLERQEKEAESLVSERERERDRAAGLRDDLERRERELEEREKSAERRVRDEARALLLDAREEVEEAIAEVRRAADGQAGRKELAEVSRRARRRVEEAAGRQLERRPDGTPSGGPLPSVEPGDRVRIVGSGAAGKVLEVRDDRAVFETGGLRMEAPLADLNVIEGGRGGDEKAGGASGGGSSGAGSSGGGSPAGGSSRAGGWTGPDVDASSEVDFRGRRVEEVDQELSRALDHAIMAALPELRIIHGKGTGALRQRVKELLEADARIDTFRAGRPGEGGTGVTIVTLS